MIATSTFLQAMLAALIVVPVIILWVAAVVDVLSKGGSGLRMAAMLVLILIVPILGPLLYFVFRPKDPVTAEDAEAMYMAGADLRRETAGRTVGGTDLRR